METDREWFIWYTGSIAGPQKSNSWNTQEVQPVSRKDVTNICSATGHDLWILYLDVARSVETEPVCVCAPWRKSDHQTLKRTEWEDWPGRALRNTSLTMEGNIIVTSAVDINYNLKAKVHVHCISRSPCDANQNYSHECFSPLCLCARRL